MRNRIKLVTRCLTFALLVWSATMVAQVAPTSEFQLNGLPTNSGLTCNYGTPCDYWNLLNGTQVNGDTGSAGHSETRTFVPGSATIENFTGGGSKDPIDIPSWKWTASSTPPKNQLTNGYAAAYQDTDLLLIFGGDRFSINGDSNIGIWFFQQKVGVCPDATNPGCAGKASGTFSGKHVDHDIFVVSAFTGGGGTSTISVYEWDHTCTGSDSSKPVVGQCADNNLRVLRNNGGVCDGNPVCAITNSAPVTPSWPYVGKSGATIGTGGFYEGGIDLTYLFAQVGVTNLPCFTSFLLETRSSQSTSAVLKDFLGGSFALCSLTVTKSCSGYQIVNGNQVQYSFGGDVTNTGAGPLYEINVDDSFPAGASNTSVNQPTTPAGGLLPGQHVSYTGSFTMNSAGNIPNTVTASAAPFDSNNASDRTVTNTGSWTACPVTPTASLTVSKSCSVSVVSGGGGLLLQVNFLGQVCNTASTATGATISGINVTDTHDVTQQSPNGTTDPVLTNITLSPGQCQSYPNTAHYLPQTCNTADGGVCNFVDTINASGTGALGVGTVTATATTAHCHVCPNGACSADTH